MSDPCQLFENIDINQVDSLDEKLRFNALKNCIPLHVSLELTQNCNFSCKHCYNFDRTKEELVRPESSRSLSKEQWKRVIDEVRKEGAFYLCFTGGEILTVPFLDELIAYAKEKGASTRIKTNGSLLTRARAERLKEVGLDDIEFSLYGATEKSHDEFTGTKGHFKRVLEALRLSKELKLNPTCNLILHKDNAREYKGMKKIADTLDIFSQCSLDLSIRHDGSRSSLDYRLNHDQLEELYRSEVNLLPKENTTGNIQCACARSNCGIGYDGSVYPCIGAPLFSGSIKEKSFKDIWNNSPVFKRIRNLKMKSFKDCSECEDRNFCQRSSGMMHLNTGEYTGSEEHTCKSAQLVKNLNQELR